MSFLRPLPMAALAAALLFSVLGPAGDTPALADELPSIADLRCCGTPSLPQADLRWRTPVFEVPLASKSLADTWIELRYGAAPLNDATWNSAISIPCDIPVALDISGEIELELHESIYHEYGGVVGDCDRTHMVAYLQFAYQPFPTIAPVARGIPGQKIWFEVWKNGTKVDGNSDPIYTTRPNGKAEWVSGDLTDVYYSDGGEWFTIKAIWNGGGITLWDGTMTAADPITETKDIWRYEGYLAAPYPDSWTTMGRQLAYQLDDVSLAVQVPAGAVADDETTVEVMTPVGMPPFQGANPAVPETPMLAFEFVQTGGAPIEQLGADVTVSVSYPEDMLALRNGLGESSLRAYAFDQQVGQWLLIDPARTTLDREEHCLKFAISRLGLYALAAELDGDGDGLGDVEELEMGTLPEVADTDGDGLADGDELWSHRANPFDPRKRWADDQHGSFDLGAAPTCCFVAARLGAGAELSPVSSSVYLGPPLDVSFTAGDDASGVFYAEAAWGDVDGDRDPDVVICGQTDGGRIARTYTNDGGTLVPRQDLTGVENTGSDCLDWGDVDGDGDLDLVLAGESDDGPVAILYRNDGDGNLSEDAGTTLIGVRYASLAWGDVDGDGDPDLALTGHDGAANVAVLYENVAGALAPFPAQPLVALRSGSADWGDLDRDGDLDLVMTGHDGSAPRTIVYVNDGDGGLSADGDHGLCAAVLSDVDLGDQDGDGDLDVAITGNTSGSGPNVARVYDNDGSGQFTQIAQPLNIYRSSCAWGDLDLDGDLDLALCGYTGTSLLTALYENAGGTFTPFAGGVFPGVREGSVHLIDVDGDGDRDFFVAGADWGTKYARLYVHQGLSTLTGVGDGAGGQQDQRSSPVRALTLRGNWPNPFNPSTTIHFAAQRAGHATLRIYNPRGALVRTLLDGPVEAGAIAAVWDGRCDAGRRVASGIYSYRLELAGAVATGKLVLAK